MRPWIGGLLLAVGTVVASVAAARGERPWIEVPLEEVVPGDDAFVLGESLPPPEGAEGDDFVEFVAGKPVDEAVLARARDQGRDTLKVLRVASPRNVVLVGRDGEGAAGRVLEHGVYTDAETGELLDWRVGAMRVNREKWLEDWAEALDAAIAFVRGGGEVLVDDDGELLSRVDWEEARGAFLEAKARQAEDAGPEPEQVGGPPDPRPLPPWTDVDWDLWPNEGFEDDSPVPLERLEALRAAVLAAESLPGADEVVKPGAFVDEAAAEKLVALGVLRVDGVNRAEWDVGVWGGLTWFALGVVLMVAGVVVLRSGAVAANQVARGEEGTEVGGAFERLLVDTRALHAERGALGVELIVERTTPLHRLAYEVVESRASLRARIGATAYAEFMSDFSTGERGLNRAWSAAVDGYDDEARAALEDALPALERAAERLTRGGPK